MKNILFVRILFGLGFLTTTLACKKTNTITIQQPTACFSVQVRDVFFGGNMAGTTTYIDSNFYFINCTDTSERISYKWDFGDGSSSTDKHPIHKYTKRGKYTVTLEVSNRGLAFDTIRQTVSVVIGQQNIGFGQGNNAHPVAIEESASGEFLLLGSTDYSTGFFLMQLDSLMKQKSRNNLPAGYRLTSMRTTSDNNYIFTGTTTGGTTENELVKLNATGGLIWKSPSTSDDYYRNVYPAASGGYVVVAAQPVTDGVGNVIQYTKIKRFDNNGVMQWENSLDGEGMKESKEAVLESDGIVVAGIKRGLPCGDYCDSVVIVKLDNSGNLIWKNTVYGGLNSSLGSMRIIKQANGNYAAATDGARGIYIFSGTGSFLDRKLSSSQAVAIANSADGNLIVLQMDWGNGFRARSVKLRMDGLELWNVSIDGRLKLPNNGMMCCADSWPIALQPLRKGGSLVVARRVDIPPDHSSYYNVMSLLQLDEDGQPK